jgi:hypothetical protein
MQFVAGQSLQDRLDRTGPLPLPEILRIGMQTASGLAAAHAQGLVHRDVKPANILLENGVERVKLTDFGLARAADDASLTQSGTVAGTPSFMSPEQAEGKPVDHRSDLFSLGSVLYAMCTGRLPFRAGTSMGVLKRVCEDTPTPIRETNPDIPDWLAAVVEKLHVKNPADRYQSASEVAELLGRHLAHVQHPSVVPLPAVANVGKPPVPDRPGRRNRSAVAAAVLVAMLAVLGTTEATGVTNVRATVIRIFTPEGTLVVETDDPAVKVVVEGDGDLVITGAGPQEVRLRAGSYRLRATKDGKPVKLDRDLVAISRGDRQIVRVWLEGEAPAAAAPPAQRGAFVVLGGPGVAERKFDTLAEAMLGSSGGDTVEVRGDGPFVCAPIGRADEPHQGALTIRAAEGFRPLLLFAENLRFGAPLVLEGLELQRVGQKTPKGDEESLVITWGSPSLHIANCRFREHLTLPCVRSNAPNCVVRNCEFLSPERGAVSLDPEQCVIDNCLVAGSSLLDLVVEMRPEQADALVQITRSTVRSPGGALGVCLVPIQPDKLAERDARRVRVDASGTILDAAWTVFVNENKPFLARVRPRPEDAKALLLRMLAWRDRSNLYAPGASALLWNEPPEGVSREFGPRNLADWKRHWASGDGDTVEGRVRYQGGDLLARLRAAPERLTTEDFRLRPDSAGYRAGKDGKDLGADVDLVGPGAAYERWKKTPEYQEWLKQTGQVKK